MLELTLLGNPKKATYKRISHPVRKIFHLFALHSNHSLYLQHKNNLIGVLDIVDGLEYHLKNLRRYEKAACNRSVELRSIFKRQDGEPVYLPKISRRTNHHPAVHEAVAYIGRLGQLATFFESKWFGSVVKENVIAGEIPSILALLPIRNKHTAHRQQDAPRHDDCSTLGLNQFGLRHGLVGPNTNPEIVHLEYSFPSKQRHRLVEKHHSVPINDIEYLGENNNLTFFTPTKNHPKIIAEAISLLQLFFGFKG
jgi:hypothetical protein